MFCIDGRVAGLEIFDSEESCKALLPKIVRSYALDAIDPAYAGYSSVSSAIVRMKRQMTKDKKLPQRIEKIKSAIMK